MAKEWRPDNWYNPYWSEDSGGTKRPDDGHDEFEEGADAILQSLYEETKAQPIWLDKADDGHILICVKQ
jgi:hypothetical protein